MKNSGVAWEVKLRDNWFYTHIYTHMDWGRHIGILMKNDPVERKKYDDLGEKGESYWSHQSHWVDKRGWSLMHK